MSGTGLEVKGKGLEQVAVAPNPIASRPWPLAFSLAALVLTFIGLFEWDVPLTRFVRSLYHPAGNLASPWLARFSDLGDLIGKGSSLVAFSAALLAVGYLARHSDWKAAGWQTLISHGVAAALSNLIKHLVGRPRPKFMHAGQLELSPISGSGWDSFPSGHTTASFAVATVVAARFPRIRWIVLSVAAAVAASRILRGSHYLTDAAGGAVLGVLAGVLIAHPLREWRDSLERALLVVVAWLAGVLALVWTIGHPPSDLWPAPHLIAAGVAATGAGLAGYLLRAAQPELCPRWCGAPLTNGLIGLGLGMTTGSPWVSTTVLCVCLACWFQRHRPQDDSGTGAGKPATVRSMIADAAFAGVVLLALAVLTGLRGVLPMR